MNDAERMDGLMGQIEALESRVNRLTRKASDLNSYFGNPLGIMDEDTEIGTELGPDGYEHEDDELTNLELRVVNLESQVQQLDELFRDLNDNLGSPVR